MGKVSTKKFLLVCFCVSLYLVVTFCYTTSALPTIQDLGSDAGKVVKEENAKTNLKVEDDEEAKSKGYFDEKPVFKWPFKPIPKPVYKPFPKRFRGPRVKKQLFSPPPPHY
ncbi:hypothetical protein Lal_00034900 [Lupinus albus]|nr:hypothetical protein Lal_00034900 [Lupinus albus]